MDLSTFWWEAESALKSIHPSLADLEDPLRFSRDQVKNVGPLLLGFEFWEQLESTPTSWSHFKLLVENAFGLTSSQLKAQFFNTKPEAGEQPSTFILRVEAARKK